MEPVENPFVDVTEGDFYYDAVLWAVQNDITSGMDNTHFGPSFACNRAQIVTFLWRAAGRPAPESNVNPFVDVKAGDYFYEAVLWGVEKGIVAGISAKEFAPNSQCTRVQVVSFLWRYMGRPVTEGTNNFNDVAPGEWYADAINWAVSEGIVYGLSETVFGLNAVCNRAQAVTFLYRALAE